MKNSVLSCLIVLSSFISVSSHASECPEALSSLLSKTAKVECEVLSSNQELMMIGRGLKNPDQTLGLNFLCTDQSCKSLQIAVSDLATKTVYRLVTKPEIIQIPESQNPSDQATMVELRVKLSLLNLTSLEWKNIHSDQFFPDVQSRVFLTDANTNREGWNWSSSPTEISQKTFKRLIESLVAPEAVRWDTYCRLIQKMTKIASTNENPENQWLQKNKKECETTGF